MIDVGVPQDDVTWLQRVANSHAAQDAEVRKRIDRIHEQAYQGLISFGSPSNHAVLQ
jgi:hypothetical protein